MPVSDLSILPVLRSHWRRVSVQVRKRAACEDPLPTAKKIRRSPACGELAFVTEDLQTHKQQHTCHIALLNSHLLCTETSSTPLKGQLSQVSRGRGLNTAADGYTPSKPPLSKPGEAHT